MSYSGAAAPSDLESATANAPSQLRQLAQAAWLHHVGLTARQLWPPVELVRCPHCDQQRHATHS